jgi:anti-sigma factor (TIGR02949 family)
MNQTNDPSDIVEIGCLEAIEALYAYLDGELDDPQAIASVEHHLGHCRSCYSRTEMERALSERMRRLAGSHAPEGLQTRLRELLDKF